MVSWGFSLGSSQPHCTFSGVALRTWCFPAADAANDANATTASEIERMGPPRPLDVGGAAKLAQRALLLQHALHHRARDGVVPIARLGVDAARRRRVPPRQLGVERTQVAHAAGLQQHASR